MIGGVIGYKFESTKIIQHKGYSAQLVQNKDIVFQDIDDDGRQVMTHNRVDPAIIVHLWTFTMFVLYPGGLWFGKLPLGTSFQNFRLSYVFVVNNEDKHLRG